MLNSLDLPEGTLKNDFIFSKSIHPVQLRYRNSAYSGLYYFMKTCKPLLGAHFSVAGGLENAIITAEDLNCNVLQMFTKNARAWQEKMPARETVQTFLTQRKKSRITTILSHASYLINIATNHPEKLSKSIHSLKSELLRSAMLRIDFVVLHPGAYLTTDAAQGIKQAARTLNQVLEEWDHTFPRLLIETTAGQGTNLGHSFEQIEMILEQTGHPEKMGVCMDTSHMFAAGYDLSCEKAYFATMDEFDKRIGFQRLYAIHLNDSKTMSGSKKDRHDHIGKGFIGLTAFEMIMNDPRFEKIPKILETPKFMDERPMDPVNLKTLLGLVNT